MPSRTGRKRLRRSAKWIAATGTSTRRHPRAAAPISISDSSTKPSAARAHGVDQAGGVDAKPRLRVGHGRAREPVDEESRHAYRRDPAGGKGHRRRALPDPAQTPADDERVRRLGGRREEPREVVGIVLAIAVHRDDALGVARERLGQPAAQRRPLAAPPPEADHVGAG